MFMVAQDSDSEAVNTCILYQSANGTIEVVWQDDTQSGWQGPQTYSALADADMGTDISCVTQTAWYNSDVSLDTIGPINRCYFQSGGYVKEVAYDGSNWTDLGHLPMD